jgi:anthranilate synthase/aminodeoxychorismate synthase-like glutamine amidotransferase
MNEVLLVDNYDSFVFNLARYLVELGCRTRVVRNDALSVSQVADLAPRAIIISPGPCTPAEAGISIELFRKLGPVLPILGVCLGHQALAAACGGQIVRAPEPVHGWTAAIHYTPGTRLFHELPNPFSATRYHSLIVDEQTLPAALRVIARTVEGLPMAIEHGTWPAWGVQFHPESVLTEGGHQLLANFLDLAGIPHGPVPAGDRVLPPSDEPVWEKRLRHYPALW